MLTRARRHLYVLSLILGLTTSGVALGGKPVTPPPPPPPPPACTDAFPSFAYEAPGRIIMLSSANGCRRDLLLQANPDLRSWSIHLSADRGSGVLVWAEDPGNAEHYVVRRLDFEVSAGGTLSVGATANVLPLLGEVVAPDEQLFYRPEVWGTPDHSALFLSTGRTHVSSNGITEISRKWMVYNLNDPTQSRVVFDTLNADGSLATWGDCTGVMHRQFVANCYERGQNVPRFSASGTRLYFDGMTSGWQGYLRLNIDNRGSGDSLLPLSAWSFSAPELVLTAPRDSTALYSEAALWGPRPHLDVSGAAQQPDPEYAGVSYLDRSGKHTVRKGLFIDTDGCVQAYVDRGLISGTISGPGDVWRTDCAPMISFYDLYADTPGAWQSADAFLQRVLSRRGTTDIYRRYATGVSAGTSQLLIEGGNFPDAGL